MTTNMSSPNAVCSDEDIKCHFSGDDETKLTSPLLYFSYGMILSVIGIVGLVGNGLVLVVFTRIRKLKGPFSTFVLNLASADFATSILHFMPVVSSFKQKWIFNNIGCNIYAFGVGQFGLVSIVTLSTIAVERYMVITAKPVPGSWKLTRQGAFKVCTIVWIYCLMITVPPLLGWSEYVLEGIGTSCSWNYTTRTLSNRLYYIYILFFGFLLPVLIIAYCYVFIVVSILDHNKEMADCNSSIRSQGSDSCDNKFSLNVPRRDQSMPIRSALRTSYIILILIALFMIAWTPYAIVTAIGQFGEKTLLKPWISSLPAIFAKASVVYNPIVYGLSHPHFRTSVKQFISGYTTAGESHADFCTPGRNNRLTTANYLNKLALFANQTNDRSNIIELKCVRHRTTQGGTNSMCLDYYSEPDCRSLTLTMEPNKREAIIKIDKVPFKVVLSSVKSKSINNKINSVVDM